MDLGIAIASANCYLPYFEIKTTGRFLGLTSFIQCNIGICSMEIFILKELLRIV